MKCVIFLCGFLVMALATQGLNDNWESFKQKFGKQYAHPMVEQQRRSIWESNMKYVERHNQQAANGQHSFTLAENQFADLTKEEFAALYNGLKIHKADTFNFHKPGPLSDIPDELDWRTKGYVTGVKDQEQCGSCWAFSAIASLEGQNFKKTGKLVALSEQNLVDCDDIDSGCGGGWMNWAFKFIQKEKGIDTEAAYPYTGEEGEKCLFDATKVGATVSGYVDVKWGSEKDLQDAVANVGPISVAIDAGHSSFQLYAKGVYYEPDCSSSELDHGVTAVGYGKEDGKDFWLVKNSWGTSWGEEGYIKMARNKDNHCGIATNASYPLV